MRTTRDMYAGEIAHNYTEAEVNVIFGITKEELENGAWNQSLETAYNEALEREECGLKDQLVRDYGEHIINALLEYYDDLDDVEDYAPRVLVISAEDEYDLGFRYAELMGTVDTSNCLIKEYFDFERYADELLMEYENIEINGTWYLWEA